jgi:hypothetical protein
MDFKYYRVKSIICVEVVKTFVGDPLPCKRACARLSCYISLETRAKISRKTKLPLEALFMN